MISSVFMLEWQLANRRAGRWPWRSIYIAVLLVESAIMTYEFAVRQLGLRTPFGFYVTHDTWSFLLHIQQIALVLLVVPALAAGTITDEKRRGTLDFLLCAPLGSFEIIVGKWLAQATLTTRLVSPAVFLHAAILGLLGHQLEHFIAVIALPTAMIYALSAVTLLASTTSRTTTRALLVVYALLVGIGIAEGLSNQPIVWLPIWDSMLNRELTPSALLRALAALAFATLVLLALAAWRLRPAHERQQSVVVSLGRWWDRPPVGDTPMRWKERYVGDWFALPAWSLMPRGVRYVLFMLAIVAIGFAAPTLNTFLVIGSLQFFLSGLFVAIRCAGTITSEREKQTWEPGS